MAVAATVHSHGPSTPEYITLQQSHTMLKNYVKEHPGELASALFANGYITQTTLNYTGTSGITNDDKALKLVDAVLSDVRLNPARFDVFLMILEKEGLVAEDILKHLKTKHADFKATHGSTSQSGERDNSIHRNVHAVQASDDGSTPTGATVIRDQCYGQPGQVSHGSTHHRHQTTQEDGDSSQDHNNQPSPVGQCSSNGLTDSTQDDRQSTAQDDVFSTPKGDRRSTHLSDSPHNSITSQVTDSGDFSTPTTQQRISFSRHSSRVSGRSNSSSSATSSLTTHAARQAARSLQHSPSVQSGLVMSPSANSFCHVEEGYNSDDSFHSVSDGEEPGGSVTKPQQDTYTKVEVSIRCKKLKDMDILSKSDPVVFVYESLDQDWRKIGRTEVINDNLNPKFSTTFVLHYYFEDVQKLKFAVYDNDDRLHIEDLSKHDFIGEAQCTLADIVTAGEQYCMELTGPKAACRSRGQIILTAEEVQDSKYTIQFEMSANNLDRKDMMGFGKSDPFLEIYKSKESGGYILVYRSEPIMKNLNPRWPQFELSIQKLCSGDWGRSLRFSVWDWNKNGKNKLIGCCYASLREICSRRKQPNHKDVKNLDLINTEIKKKKKKYTSSGTLNLDMVKAIPTHTFTDYIRGGCQINLMVAIDFTESNGKPGDPNSLHYNGPGQTADNEYVKAIKSVGNVLGPYDSDQLIPAFGFGAKLPPNGHISHCFPLNFNSHDPEVHGVQGLLEAYHKTLMRIEFSGPTNFSQFLDKARQYARLTNTTQEKQNYTILLVITDGVICDMAQTVDRIVEASLLPLSIVIVGVGEADFKDMEVLDADTTPLRNQRGVPMKRDIVQFVPLRKFISNSKSGNNFSLAREVLAEIPTQLTSFMKSRKIRPNPPRSASQPALQTSLRRSASPPGQPPLQQRHSEASLPPQCSQQRTTGAKTRSHKHSQV